MFEVLSHKNWGASSSLMSQISRDSYDYDKFPTISKLLWEGLEGRPAAWRVVFKALTLLEYLIKNGSERCIDESRTRDHKLRSLYNFNYFEGSVDRGSGVREKSKQIVELLQDNERIREEREKAKELRGKFSGVGSEGGSYGNSGGGGGGGGGYGNDSYSSQKQGGGGGYGNDSYSSSNSGGYGGDTRASNSGYGNSGIGSNSRGGGASSNSNSRGRYSDNEPTLKTSVTKTKTDMFDVVQKANKDGKIKINLPGGRQSQKAADMPAPAPAAPPPAQDLFSFDAPTPSTAPAAAGFDAFGTSTSTGGNDFAAFHTAPPAAPPAPVANDFGFDAFAQTPAAPPAPVQQDFGFAAQPVQQQNFGGFQQQPQQQQFNNNAFAPAPVAAPVQSFVSAAPIQPSNATVNTSVDEDFGGFSSAEQAKPNDLAGLVQLDGLTTNKTEKKSSSTGGNATGNQHSSFSGLDGFGAASMGMGMSTNNMPMPNNNMSRPQQPAMMSPPQQQNMGMQQSMMGQQPQMAMGGGMGMQPQGMGMMPQGQMGGFGQMPQGMNQMGGGMGMQPQQNQGMQSQYQQQQQQQRNAAQFSSLGGF
ncbi:hypothetical protein TL16_g11568 [Triparma laevis f. inornata]|uniref:ENTH domain-containing protein n=1 Tax=Triparma laevis f. inornata TaxID=1714386 RepID=A0A9W7ER43_9STRA|nr:hypothetical protein TL16_g11568 [Triparma laevis f. inornata]